jgi:hypothetical protein
MSYTLIIYNPSLPATFTQSNNNNVANQVKTCHFYASFRLSPAKVRISSETAKQFVTFFAKKLHYSIFRHPIDKECTPFARCILCLMTLSQEKRLR